MLPGAPFYKTDKHIRSKRTSPTVIVAELIVEHDRKGHVSQGSVISPLLFLIYNNDITKASSFHTTLFADDINLHMSNSSFNVLQTTVNLELC